MLAPTLAQLVICRKIKKIEFPLDQKKKIKKSNKDKPRNTLYIGIGWS